MIVFSSINEDNSPLIYPGIVFRASHSPNPEVQLIQCSMKELNIFQRSHLRFIKPQQENKNIMALSPDFGIASGVYSEEAMAVAEQAMRDGTMGASWLFNGDDRFNRPG